MMFQLIMGLVIAGLVVLYIYLKRTGYQEKNLPSVSEDINLPAVSQPNPPEINDLENKGPQRQ